MSVGGCWKQECQTTAGCMCGKTLTGMWPGEISRPLFVPADGDHFNMAPGKVWYVVPGRDWIDVIAGTADG